MLYACQYRLRVRRSEDCTTAVRSASLRVRSAAQHTHQASLTRCLAQQSSPLQITQVLLICFHSSAHAARYCMTNLSMSQHVLASSPCTQRYRHKQAIMAAWGQACRVATRAGAASLRRQRLLGVESHATNSSACSSGQQFRGMASGG